MQSSKKSIGIFGLGVTGISVYEDLKKDSQTLIVYDDSITNRDNFIARFGEDSIVSIENERWKRLDKIIISPGVPHSHPIFELAKASDIPITSDIELFIEKNPSSEFIFITGTNGKSTTTALVGHILAQSGMDYHIGGNIGKPVMALPMNRKGYVFELSSFQIELLNKINPKISVITNITPDHLDRYSSVKEYAAVKKRILLPDALKIIGINSEISRGIYEEARELSLRGGPALDRCGNLMKLGVIPVASPEIATPSLMARNDVVGLESPCNDEGIFCDDQHLFDNHFDHQKYQLPDLPHLRGAHNKENIGISYAICRALGVLAESILESLQSFKGLEHRMQYVGRYKNIEFYNDSKATNVSSALSSLSVFDNIIWFAGGKFKEDSLEGLETILKNIKKVYLFGESKGLFAEYLRSKVDYEICEDLSEAFTQALKYSKKVSEDLTFLLAPACASYDQFKNYEERGRLFCDLVQKISKSKVQNHL